MQGWIKLHRCLTEKAIWLESTPEQKVILVTLLMMANHTEKEWEWKGEKYKAKPGQFVTSLNSIVRNCGRGISVQNVRTALKRFEKYGFLTSESTNRNRLITITNWASYQSEESESTNQPTSNQQATNKQLTTNKNDKNDKNEKKYIEVLDYWNKHQIVTHSQTPRMLKEIAKGLKKHSIEDIKKAIDRYATIYKDSNYYYAHKWTLDKFLNQSNGVPNYLDEGMMWVNYQNEQPKPTHHKELKFHLGGDT